jgi:CDP-diglyceride synthetase
MPPPSKNLVQRIIVAVIAIPAVVGIIWVGGWLLAATLAILGVLGAREIYDFARSCTGPSRRCTSARCG